MHDAARSSGGSVDVGELEDGIRQQLVSAEPLPPPPSAYDTAWVAWCRRRVPSGFALPTVRGLDPAEPARRRVVGVGARPRHRGRAVVAAGQGRALVDDGVRPGAPDVGRW